MPSEPADRVAVVGGGFSGTMVAAHLARRGKRSLLFEGAGRVGRGTAYATREPAHLLNVRAEGMSAWPEAPDHFAAAYEACGGDPKGFAERRFFGDYLRGILEEALASGLVEVVPEAAHAARPGEGGWTVEGSSRSWQAAALVLAQGNQPPEPLAGFATAGAAFVNNPWSAEAAAAVQDVATRGGDVLLVGTGLTMVDLGLSLDAAGHRGRIVAVSRRGLLPRAHAAFTPAPVAAEAVPQGDLLGLWRWVRRRAGAFGWRAAVDGLRPYSQALWQTLSEDDQRRFLRHARPWWDVHRHRIAPQVAGRLQEMVADGRLDVRAGRIGDVQVVRGGLKADIRRRGQTHPRPNGGAEAFAAAFNCTGPLGAVDRTRDPLLRGLLDGGLARADALGIGLDVDACSRVPTAPRCWALGPLTKGRYWEIVAVPDIRGQAAAVAADIEEELGA